MNQKYETEIENGRIENGILFYKTIWAKITIISKSFLEQAVYTSPMPQRTQLSYKEDAKASCSKRSKQKGNWISKCGRN